MDDVVLAIIDLFKTNLEKGVYLSIYYGENRVPAQADFPFVEVVPARTEMRNNGTNSMMNDFYITVNAKDTLKAFLGEDKDEEIIEYMQEMVKRIEARTDGKPDSDTILGVLHDNLKLENNVHITDDWEIDYQVSEFNGSYILVGSVSFKASLISLRS